jgi:DNA invertase Pin-like site-specific DNA recombinase
MTRSDGSSQKTEAGLISERTKAALAAAKARGVKLGNPNGARALRGKQKGNKEALAAITRKAQEHASNVASILEPIRAQGITSVRKTAEELNCRGIPRSAWRGVATNNSCAPARSLILIGIT